MDWTEYKGRAGFSFEHPMGWSVETPPGSILVHAPDGHSLVVMQQAAFPRGATTGRDILSEGSFTPAFYFLHGTRAESVAAEPDGSAHGIFRYRMHNGVPCLAHVRYLAHGDKGRLVALAASETDFPGIEPVLRRIISSFRSGEAVPLLVSRQPETPPTGAPLTYVPYTEPQMGTFTTEVPRGWRVRGGFAHPIPGDRRPWFEALSPDGIYILFDPDFPQNLCHFPGQPEGQFAAMAAGGSLLNLKPTAERIGDHYLKNLAVRRFGTVTLQERRQRPDLLALLKSQIFPGGAKIPRGFSITTDECILRISQDGQQRVASVLSEGAFNGQYTMGMWGFWGAGVTVYAAPPQLVARAEAVRWHMKAVLNLTPRFHQLVQQDEAIIHANGQAAHAAQLNWFAGQQAVHQSMVSAGEAMIANYWSQQASQDAAPRGWEQIQAVNDRLAQSYSDALLDRQRLADDGTGKTYDVAAGHNYYWIDQNNGSVFGTDTGDPPDYTNTYKPLRKL